MNRFKDEDGGEPNGEINYKEQLQHYKQKILNILESFTDAFFEVDENWVVTYWNREAERLLLMPRDQIIGVNLWQAYREAIPLKFFTEYHRAIESNVSVRFEEYFPPLALWLEVAAFPSGQGLSVYFKDVTERKHATDLLKEEKQRYSELFNLSPLPQWVFDVHTLSFLDVNEAAIAHYGYSRAEFMQMTISDIRPDEDLSSLNEALKNYGAKRVFSRISARHKKKDGEIIQVQLEGNAVTFAGIEARLVMAIDRTAELKAKIAMEESIVEKAIQLKAIEAQNERLQEISWIQSHKVRGPLARILGLARLIGDEQIPDSEQTEFIFDLRTAAEELDLVLMEIVNRT